MSLSSLRLFYIYFAIVALSLVSCSSDSDPELDLNLEHREECINYDFSFDTLQLASFTYDNGIESKNLTVANSGVGLLGYIVFDSDRFKLWIRAREINDSDTIIYEYRKEGAYTFELDTMTQWFVNDRANYSRYNSLNLYPDNDKEILNIRQKITCELYKQTWDQFYLDSLKCRLHFQHFE